ncbi:MAG TPA: HAMP domain-containing sensor histidine kinase [Candidatus Dormibacteraeota bacterium]
MRRLLGSLRLRLTLTYVALLALLLAAFGVFQYVTLQRNLVDVRAAALHGDVAEALRVTSQQARAALCATAPASGQRTAAGVVATRISVAAGGQVGVLILDRRLNVLAARAQSGAQASDLPRLSSEPLDAALAGQTPAPQVIDGANGAELVTATPIPLQGGVCAVAQLSTPMEPLDTVLARSLRLLVAGSLTVLLVALVVGLVVTGRTLRPLSRLTETARRLAGGDLRARSGVTPREDEVGTLAHSFDEMAGRIEASFIAQAESEARMRRFIADASHELRTPVTALKGYIDVLRRGVSREPEALDAALAAMARESDRLRVLVLDLLTLARLDAQRPPELSPLDLNEVVAGVLDEGVPGMPEQLERSLAPAPVTVLADRGSIITLARNLLVNACKYAPGARQVWATELDGTVARLVVRDHGPGISPADLPHVFERFYRGEKTRAREEGGSGLGLSIVLGLARAMGGDAVIEATEGIGTTVTVWIPRAPATHADQAAAPGPA